MEAKIEISMDSAVFVNDRNVNGNQCGVFWIEED